MLHLKLDKQSNERYVRQHDHAELEKSFLKLNKIIIDLFYMKLFSTKLHATLKRKFEFQMFLISSSKLLISK